MHVFIRSRRAHTHLYVCVRVCIHTKPRTHTFVLIYPVSSCLMPSLSFSARTWASSRRCRWVTTTPGSTQSGWWSVCSSGTRSQGTRTSEHDSATRSPPSVAEARPAVSSWPKQNDGKVALRCRPAGSRAAAGWVKVWMTAV